MKIISDTKMLALLIQAYDAGRKSGKLDEYSQAYDANPEVTEFYNRQNICLALVEQASIPGD